MLTEETKLKDIAEWQISYIGNIINNLYAYMLTLLWRNCKLLNERRVNMKFANASCYFLAWKERVTLRIPGQR
jgi:hypothetical protein